MYSKIVVISSKIYRILPYKPFRLFFRKLYRHYIHKHNSDIVRVVRDGINLELHLNEVIEHNIYYHGSFEPTTRQLLTNLTKPNMVVFDVGSNIGVHTFYMARNVRPNGCVYAFEPASYAYNKLQMNFRLNSQLPVKLEKMALSNENITSLKTQVACSWPVDSSFSRKENQAMNSSRVMDDEITLIKLDDYIHRNSIQKLDIIKLDIDGNEMKFFEGASLTISKFKPIITFELADYVLRHYDSSADELINLILSYGYKIFNENLVEFSIDSDPNCNKNIENYSINLVAINK